jgi:hypothetical protein
MRTTRKDLERLRERVAKLQGRPMESWTKQTPTTETPFQLKANIGAIHLDHNATYGGWDLCEIVNEHGGEHSLIGNTFAGRGRLNAHEMESFLLGMLAVLEEQARNGSPDKRAFVSDLLTNTAELDKQ